MSTEARHTPIPPRPAAAPDPPHRPPAHRPAAPPPAASARFPDAPPAPPAETTGRLRPVPPAPAAPPETATPVPPNPALPWSAASVPGETVRPAVRFGEPESYDDRPRLLRARAVAAAACLVLGLGLIGGAVTGSWLVGGAGGDGDRGAFATAADLWHSAPVDDLFPPTVTGTGAGPGGADRTWTRIAVAPDGGCADAFDPLLRKALTPVGCARLLRATYTDATRSHVTTVGLLFTRADAAAMRSLDQRFDREGLARRTDLVPRPYAAKGTVAAGFGDEQRASWTVSVLTEAPVVVYAVSGWADGRRVDAPQPAAEAMRSGATTGPGQAGLGHEAKGLADRVERSLRRTITSPTEQPS